MKELKIAVIVDAQHSFIDGELGSPVAARVANNIVEYMYTHDGQYDYILCTKDLHGENYLNTLEGKNLPIEHCIAGTVGGSLYYALNQYFFEKVNPNNLFTLNKSTFMAPNLGETISNFLIIPNLNGKDAFNYPEGVKVSFDIFGFDTDICVVSNALLLRRDFPESEIRCISNLCAGTTLENHEAALKVMKSCQIEVI